MDYQISDEYRELAETVIGEREDLAWIRSAGVRIDYVTSLKEKKSGNRCVHAECKKINDFQQVYCPYDFVIVIYLPNVAHMSVEQKKILLWHELLHIDFREGDSGTRFCIRHHDIEDFKTIIRQYGLDWSE